MVDNQKFFLINKEKIEKGGKRQQTLFSGKQKAVIK